MICINSKRYNNTSKQCVVCVHMHMLRERPWRRACGCGGSCAARARSRSRGWRAPAASLIIAMSYYVLCHTSYCWYCLLLVTYYCHHSVSIS